MRTVKVVSCLVYTVKVVSICLGIDWVGWRLAYENVHVYSESCFYKVGGIDWVGWRLAYEKVHVYSESCFYTFGGIDWVGWRLAYEKVHVYS